MWLWWISLPWWNWPLILVCKWVSNPKVLELTDSSPILHYPDNIFMSFKASKCLNYTIKLSLILCLLIFLPRTDLHVDHRTHPEPPDDRWTHRTGVSCDQHYPFAPGRPTGCHLGAHRTSWYFYLSLLSKYWIFKHWKWLQNPLLICFTLSNHPQV